MTRTAELKTHGEGQGKLLLPEGTSNKGHVVPACVASTDVKEADIDSEREDTPLVKEHGALQAGAGVPAEGHTQPCC